MRRKTLPLLLCASLLSACATVRPDSYRPEDCFALGTELRKAEAWHKRAEYTALGLGAGTALADAAKDSKALTLSFAVAALLAGAVGVGAQGSAQLVRTEIEQHCADPKPLTLNLTTAQ